jgi:hypothetical protein
MSRMLIGLTFTVVCLACGPKPRPIPDAGNDDAGVDAGEIDAGRPRGDDPPNGWMTAVELPAGSMLSSRMGVSVSSAPDQFSQPLLAAIFDDPNGDGTRSDSRIVFTRWNGTTKKFQDLKQIEVVADVDVSFPHRQVSVARDAETGRIGIAYVKAIDSTIRYAYSDDEGENFSLSSAAQSNGMTLSNPVLLLKNGVAHLSFVRGASVVYAKRLAASVVFSETASDAAIVVANAPIDMKFDSAGAVGIVYFESDALKAKLNFWRPNEAPVMIANSDTTDVLIPTRYPSVSLTFVGTVGHVAFHLRKVPELSPADMTEELFYAKQNGTAWTSPVAIPRNGNGIKFHSTRFFQALTIDSTSRVNIAACFAASGSQLQFGGPKLARSADGVLFDTQAPAATPAQFAGAWLSMWLYKMNKQTIVFHYDEPIGSRATADLKPGIVMWREP